VAGVARTISRPIPCSTLNFAHDRGLDHSFDPRRQGAHVGQEVPDHLGALADRPLDGDVNLVFLAS